MLVVINESNWFLVNLTCAPPFKNVAVKIGDPVYVLLFLAITHPDTVYGVDRSGAASINNLLLVHRGTDHLFLKSDFHNL